MLNPHGARNGTRVLNVSQMIESDKPTFAKQYFVDRAIQGAFSPCERMSLQNMRTSYWLNLYVFWSRHGLHKGFPIAHFIDHTDVDRTEVGTETVAYNSGSISGLAETPSTTFMDWTGIDVAVLAPTWRPQSDSMHYSAREKSTLVEYKPAKCRDWGRRWHNVVSREAVSVSVLEQCRSELCEVLKELIEFVRSHRNEINNEHRQRWHVIRANGEKQFDLRNEVRPDYSFFLGSRVSDFIRMRSFENLAAKVEQIRDIANSLRLNVVSPQPLFLYYVLPVAITILGQEDAGQERHSAESTVLEQLDEFLTTDTFTAELSAVLKNFTSEVADVELGDGVFLRTLPDSIQENHINVVSNIFGHVGIMGLKESNFHFESVVKQGRTSAIYPMVIGGDFQQKTEQLLKALRLIKPGAVGFFYTAGEVISPIFMTSTWMIGPDTQFLHGAEYRLTQADSSKVKAMLSGMDCLAGDNRFSLALGRLMEAYRKPFTGDRLIDAWIGLESLLLPAEKEGELRFRAALRGAWFLGEDSAERAKIFGDLKKSYDCRSAVVHGSEKSVPENTVLQTEDYLRQVLRKCIESESTPTPELLNSLVMGGDLTP